MSTIRFESDGTALGTKVYVEDALIAGIGKLEFIIDSGSPTATIRLWVHKGYEAKLKELLKMREKLDESNIMEVCVGYEAKNFSGIAGISIEIYEPPKDICKCGHDPCVPHEHAGFDPDKDI